MAYTWFYPPTQPGMPETSWGGNCFGFSASAYAFYTGSLRQSNFQTGITRTFDFPVPRPRNDQLTNLIELYQISQYLPDILSYYYTNHQNYNNLPALIHATNSEDALVFLYWGDNAQGRRVGHAVIIYGIEELGSNRFALRVYDNNQPMNNDLRVEVNMSRPDSLTWAFNATDNQRYNGWRNRSFSFIGGDEVLSAIQNALANRSNGIGGNTMQILTHSSTLITNMHGLSIDRIAGTQMVTPLGTLPLDPDGSAPNQHLTGVMWVVPMSDYIITPQNQESIFVMVHDSRSTYKVEMYP